MKSFAALALLCCLCSSVPQLVAQTKKNQPPPYKDTDGYQVLSAVIKARTEKSGAGSVPIFYQTVSGGTNGEIMAECSSRFPEEFQSALAHLNKMTKTKFVLQRQFSFHKEYRLVETMVGVQTGIYSLSAVGFDEDKARAIVLVQYLVRPPGSLMLGGDSTFYLLRRTKTGWEQAAGVPECGRIY